jgi:hypothetical protein
LAVLGGSDPIFEKRLVDVFEVAALMEILISKDPYE